MPARDHRRHSSLSRRLDRPDAERRTSMELPERFRHAELEPDDEEQEDAAKGIHPPFMHQSIFGMIAATQSKINFHSLLHGPSNSDDDEDMLPKTARLDGESSSASSPLPPPPPPPSSGLGRKKPSLVPGLRAKGYESSLPIPHRPGSRHPLQLPVRKTTAPVAGEDNDDEGAAAVEAPFMSQMLQARARADIDSSEATLTKPESERRRASPSPSLRSVSTALPDALRDIFQFDSAEEVVAEYPCWYLQSVLLEGYMYITEHHISFYAYLPKKSNTTVKSGYLSKRGKRNPQYRRWWFVLKGDVLSYYADPSDPYFPRDSIDLRYGISADLLPEKEKSKDGSGFSISTNARTFYFRADSPQSAKEWVKQLQKIIFRSRNDSDSVKISIPTDNVLDVEENPLLDFADTIKIRVIDNDETFAVDEYFFSFFGFGEKALHDLRLLTRDTPAQRAITVQESASPIRDFRGASHEPGKVSSRSPGPTVLHENVRATLSPGSAMLSSPRNPRVEDDLNASSLDLNHPDDTRHESLRSYSDRRRLGNKKHKDSSSAPPQSPRLDDPTEQPNQGPMIESIDDADASGSQILSSSTVFHDPTIRKPHSTRSALTEAVESARHNTSPDLGRNRGSQPSPEAQAEAMQMETAAPSQRQTAGVDQSLGHNARKSRQQDSSRPFGGLMRAGTNPIQLATGYLKGQSKAVASLLGTSPMEYYDKVSGMIAGGKRHYSEADGLSTDDRVRDPDDEMDVLEAERRFRDHFALPESEKLVATYFAFLHRVLPLYGKIYVGTTRLCFRSLLLGTRTKLIIPLKDILNVDKEKGFRLGYQGMVVVIRGHEEIFFEFGKQGHRDDCTITILRSLDVVKPAQEPLLMTEGERLNAEAAAAENLLLNEARKDAEADRSIEIPRRMRLSESDAPAIIFDDPGASMLDFKPPEPLRIVCLTIGSRGDVQPYIALCKGLLAEGHKPKIATHAEFGPWVEQHGIEFAPVEGDPAELMRICVDNGMFTPSFLYEANFKFRDFVRTLLVTAWEACKDAEVLIESPSAMAGIHIAEALGIPYFRAFTMPWTRTRAYPHAFAVPTHRMGGAYNYMSYTLFDHLFWQCTSGMINRWRGDALNLKPTNSDKLQQDKVPFLYNFSPSVVVPPLDFSEWIRVTGYWFLNEGDDYTPPDELQNFIEKARKDGEKLVYIGFGSVVVANSRQLTQSVVDAVLKADVRCILAKGWSDRLDKNKEKGKSEIEVPLPDSILQIKYPVPHDWLFRQVDAAVHHGGAGTTGASLRAGVPTIIHPFFGDQFFFSNRIQDLGVGIEVKRITTNILGRALWIACHDHRMIEKAKLLGEQIRSENGVANAIKSIYRDMEYAKTLIKKRESAARPTSRGGGSRGSDHTTNIGMDDDDHVDEEGEDDQEEDSGDAEEWTLVENDSDPEAASPRAMMQPEQSRGGGNSGKMRSGGLVRLAPLRRRQ